MNCVAEWDRHPGLSLGFALPGQARRPVLLLVLVALLSTPGLGAQWGGELRFSIRSEPRSFHPALADSDAAETIRYLTGGVLVRVNRGNQQLEPELATSWKIENGGRSIIFQLRPGVFFSDGTPFSAEDVVYTMNVLLDPALNSATGDTFQAGGGAIHTMPRGKYEVAVAFPEPVAGVARLFDQVAILSHNSPLKERAALGAFRIAEHKPGSFILLARNPNYWKTDGGRRLPYLDGVRLEIQQNRELELLRFRRGEVDLISSLGPDQFQQLAAEGGAVGGLLGKLQPQAVNPFLRLVQGDGAGREIALQRRPQAAVDGARRVVPAQPVDEIEELDRLGE